MALLLNIDTATETGSIALSRNEKIIMVMVNADQKDHAAWIHNAIDEMMTQCGHSLKELDAVAVTSGPGSYTGLRVGMATAKGLCYALHIPLITESTLKMMAYAARAIVPGVLYCPMIDARRMEVFTAIYDEHLAEVMKPQPMILDERSFAEQNNIIFFGSGSHKLKKPNASFADVSYNASHLAPLAHDKFQAANFTDLAYAEPVYLKEFYTHTRK